METKLKISIFGLLVTLRHFGDSTRTAAFSSFLHHASDTNHSILYSCVSVSVLFIENVCFPPQKRHFEGYRAHDLHLTAIEFFSPHFHFLLTFLSSSCTTARPFFINTTRSMSLGPSPGAFAFSHIQWDRLNSLRLTAQETALLRMAETNPIDYTLADSRDASMYARVLLKLLAEASAGSTGSGAAALLGDNPTEEQVMLALEEDPLGVVTHYALSKLHEIITTLNAGTSGVTVAAVFYVGKEGILVDQWKALLRILQKGGKGDPWAQKCAALCLAQILIVSCPSMRTSGNTVKDKDGKTRPISYASAMEPLDAVTGWIVSQLKNQTGLLVGLCIPALTALMEATETRRLFSQSSGVKYLSRQLRNGCKGSKGTVVGGDGNTIGQSSVQQLYELAFCMWNLTYELNPCYPVRCDFAKDGNAISALVDLVSVAPREKVVRVALSALVICATCTDDESPAPAGSPKYDGKHFLGEMIACGLMKSMDNLKDRQFTDPDIIMGMLLASVVIVGDAR